MATRKSYRSSAELQNYLMDSIAPNYFDFDNTNNYRLGLFGYFNEVLSVITMDTHNSINNIRREFYPVSATSRRSFYKMATLQNIGLPMATPARCKAILLLDRDEIIENSTYNNGVYSCVIDDTVQIQADNLSFVLLYPIVILSSQKNKTVWNHTVHYDKSDHNDLEAGISTYYIPNRTINRDGKHYLLLSVNMYQCQRESISEIVTKDSAVETVSIIFDFEGKLANFEVYYIEEPESSKPVHLIKLLENQGIPSSPFCYYRLLNDNQIEISFPKNIVFNPELNSEIRLDVYTSDGENGNFESYSGELACNMESELYPYNNNMTMMGKINGKCQFGKNAPSFEEYKNIIKKAYATNSTLTTTNDIQEEFDSHTNSKNMLVFRKVRHDAFNRIYGAFMLLKDKQDNVVPTNTITLNMLLEEFDSYNTSTTKAVIKPGTIFEYDPDSFTEEIFTGKRSDSIRLRDDLSIYDAASSEDFIYTNPFLIMVTMNPNLVGYYINSFDETHALDYEYINDNSMVQFIGNNLKFKRNAIAGEDFYKISIQISPTQDLSADSIVYVPSPTDDADYYIRADQDGIVESIVFDDEVGTVVANLRYDTGELDQIQIGSFVDQTEEEEPENGANAGGDEDDETLSEETNPTEEDEESGDKVNLDDGYYYHTGYELQVDVNERFVEGDILATKKCKDLGRIRAGIDIDGTLHENGLYIPMVIEDYNEDDNIFTLVAYMSTDDIVDSNDQILIGHGIYGLDGGEDDDIALTYNHRIFNVSVFYKNFDTNYEHKYGDFDYFHLYTLTNTYSDSDEDGLNFIQDIRFIRSDLTFYETEVEDEEGVELPTESTDEEEEETTTVEEEETEEEEEETTDLDEDDIDETINICIKDVPLVKANWLKEPDNFSYLLANLQDNYETLTEMYYNLENNYGFELKFYNSYGKSKFYQTGYVTNFSALTRVDCQFKFGVYLTSLTATSTFLSKFKEFVKNYIESTNTLVGTQQSIYIMNLIYAAKEEFSEIGYMEYYGFNGFSQEYQKIEPIATSEMSDTLLKNYIPEFINIPVQKNADGDLEPMIEVTLLNPTEE